MIKLTIAKEDNEKAQEHVENGGGFNCGCLVFQAVKRAGLNPTHCGVNYIICSDSEGKSKRYRLNDVARAITNLTKPEEWVDCVGREIELTPI